MLLRLVTPPALEPVTLAEAKAQLRIEHALDDTFIDTLLIPAARQWVEGHCRRGVVTQTWEMLLEAFPSSGVVELAKGSLASVESVKYLDADGAEQTMATSDYEVDLTSVPGRVLLGYGKSWPDARCVWNAVRLRFVVGVGVGDVPASIKQAVLLLVSQMYEQRVPEVTGTIVTPVKFAVEALLNQHRVVML